MKNPLENENAQQSLKSGQEVGKNPSPAVSTHGGFAKLKQRIQRNTRKYYGANTAPQYLIRVQCRRRREWFELGSDLDVGAKLAREIDQFLRLNGWDATRKKYKPEFAAERSELTLGGFIDLVSQHGQLDPCTVYGYASRFRRVVSGIRRIKFGGADKFIAKRWPPSLYLQCGRLARARWRWPLRRETHLARSQQQKVRERPALHR